MLGVETGACTFALAIPHLSSGLAASPVLHRPGNRLHSLPSPYQPRSHRTPSITKPLPCLSSSRGPSQQVGLSIPISQMGMQDARAFVEVSMSPGCPVSPSIQGLPVRSWSIPPDPVHVLQGLRPADGQQGELPTGTQPPCPSPGSLTSCVHHFLSQDSGPLLLAPWRLRLRGIREQIEGQPRCPQQGNP